MIIMGIEVGKRCPECGIAINPEWTHAYENNWCPACGCGIEIAFKDREVADNGKAE